MANRKPVVEGDDQTKAPGTKIALKDLFDWSDKDGPKDITSFSVRDGKGGGNLTRDGKPQAEGKTHEIPASEIGRWAYNFGPKGSEDTITLKAIDKAKASDSDTAKVTSAVPNAPPDVDGHDLTKAAGAKVPLLDLFTVSDKDGLGDISSVKLSDAKGGGYLMLNGKAQAEGKTHTVDIKDLDDWVYVAGPAGSKDVLTLSVSDRAGASDKDVAEITSRGASGTDAIQLVSPVAGPAAWQVGQAPGGTTSHNADLYHSWDFSLAKGLDEFGFGVYAVAAGTVKWIVEHVRDGDASQMTKDFSHGPSGSLGNIVTIEHKVDGVTFYSSYFHLRQDSVTVSVGDKVRAGELIAEIGNTGVRDGTHLHLNLGFTYGPFTNSAGNSFSAYMIAEGPRDPNLLSKFDFIDSPRASKELQVGDQFVSTTPSRGSSNSSSNGQSDGLPGIGGGDDLSLDHLFERSPSERATGTEGAGEFARVSLSAFSQADFQEMEPIRFLDPLAGAWDLP